LWSLPKKGTQKKASLARQKGSLASTTTTNDRAMGTRATTPKLGAAQVAFFQRVTQIGDNRWQATSPIPMEKRNRPTCWEQQVNNRVASVGDRGRLEMGRQMAVPVAECCLLVLT
jgi:hypothetical protein